MLLESARVLSFSSPLRSVHRDYALVVPRLWENATRACTDAMKSSSWFTRFAKASARATGRPAAFIAAALVIIGWAATGALFHFSDTWQLVINTATTIVTFLMVFLIQNTQNRDSEAIQIKLDELIRALHDADNRLMDLEELEESELDAFRARYQKMAEQARSRKGER